MVSDPLIYLALSEYYDYADYIPTKMYLFESFNKKHPDLSERELIRRSGDYISSSFGHNIKKISDGRPPHIKIDGEIIPLSLIPYEYTISFFYGIEKKGYRTLKECKILINMFGHKLENWEDTPIIDKLIFEYIRLEEIQKGENLKMTNIEKKILDREENLRRNTKNLKEYIHKWPEELFKNKNKPY